MGPLSLVAIAREQPWRTIYVVAGSQKCLHCHVHVSNIHKQREVTESSAKEFCFLWMRESWRLIQTQYEPDVAASGFILAALPLHFLGLRGSGGLCKK